MSAKLSPAAVVPAPATTSAPTHPHPEDSDNRAGVPIAAAPVLASPLPPDNVSHLAPPLMGASPHTDTIQDAPPIDNAPPKRKASHRPGYLDYEEQKFREGLNGLIDPTGWSQHHEEVTKDMVSDFVSIPLGGCSFLS
jgi:hypothetical protein